MMRRQVENQRHQDQLSRVFDELSALVMSLLRSPLTQMPIPDQSPAPSRRLHPSQVSKRKPRISPAGFAWLMLGISVSLMLCGSVTFFIGFMLMPWIIGLVMVLYVAGVVSAVSMVARSILCFIMAPSPARKEIPALVLVLCCIMLTYTWNIPGFFKYYRRETRIKAAFKFY